MNRTITRVCGAQGISVCLGLGRGEHGGGEQPEHGVVGAWEGGERLERGGAWWCEQWEHGDGSMRQPRQSWQHVAAVAGPIWHWPWGPPKHGARGGCPDSPPPRDGPGSESDFLVLIFKVGLNIHWLTYPAWICPMLFSICLKYKLPQFLMAMSSTTNYILDEKKKINLDSVCF